MVNLGSLPALIRPCLFYYSQHRFEHLYINTFTGILWQNIAQSVAERPRQARIDIRQAQCPNDKKLQSFHAMAVKGIFVESVNMVPAAGRIPGNTCQPVPRASYHISGGQSVRPLTRKP